MDAARKAFGERIVVEETPYVCANGMNNDPEGDFCHVYRIPLDLSGKRAHFKNARHWNYTQLNNTPDPAFFFFQLLVLMMETADEGSVRPRITEDSDPKEYKELIERAAKVAIGKGSVDDHKYVSRMTVCDSRLSTKFLHDLSLAKERAKVLQLHKMKKKKGESAKKKRKKDVVVPAAPKKPNLINPLFVRQHMDELVINEKDDCPPPPPEHEAYLNDLRRAAVDAIKLKRYNQERQLYLLAGEEDEEEDDHSQAIDEEDPDSLPDMPPIVPWQGVEDLVSKVQFTLTPVPVENGDKKNPDDIAGLMLSFFVRDPQWNPGTFFERLLKNNRNREVNRMNPRGRTNAVEMFPHYVTLMDSLHPAGASTDIQRYFQCALSYDPAIGKDQDGEWVSRNRLFQRMDILSFSSKFHLSNLLTLENAFKYLEQAGCDASYLTEREWYNREDRTGVFPFDLDTYKYMSEGVFWYHRKYIGLREHLFPYVTLDADFLAQLMAGADPDALLREDGEQMVRAEDGERLDPKKISSAMKEIRDMIARDWRVERSKLQDKKLIHYRTNNEFVHRYAESLLVNSQVMKYYPKNAEKMWFKVQEAMAEDPKNWRVYLDPEWEEVVDRYETYKKIRVRAQMACMKIFKGLWLLEGNIDDLPIPDMIKVVQKWYRDTHRSKLPNMTRNFKMSDRELGMFSNYILRLMTMYARVANIVHPIICVMAIGLFSTYQQKRELKYHMLGHGWHATGKTRTTIVTFKKFTAIPGTTDSFCTSTAASDTTQRHVYDSIILSDEVQPWKVDPQEAAKNPVLVNKAKVKMTDNQIGHNVFVNYVLEDGTNRRWTDLITTDHFYTSVEVTNSEVSAQDALASRYHRFTMPLPKVPIHKMQGNADDELENATKLHLHVGHYLMCCAQKCASVGGIVSEPDKELFSNLGGRVVDYLIARNAISQENAIRGMDIMWPLVRQYIYMWAVVCAFDMPSSPNYQKKFEVDMIREIQPYLYMTMEHFWFGWTALGSQWVEDNNSKFIEAVETYTGYAEVKRSLGDELETASNYAVYENDVRNKVTWCTRIQRECAPDEKAKGHHRLLDLNYVTIDVGGRKALANTLAPICGLSPSDILGLINTLSERVIKIVGGAYVLCPKPLMKEWHQKTNSKGKPGNKRIDVNGNAMPDEFKQVNPDTKVPRTEEDMPRQDEDLRWPVIDLRDESNGKIHIMPGIADLFKNGIIQDALLHATMHQNFPVGKIITGTPSEDSTTVMECMVFTQDLIDQQVKEFDEEDGWKQNARGDLEWTGDAGVPEEMRPYSRRDGVTIERLVKISHADRAAFDTPLAPISSEDVLSWEKRKDDALDAMKESRVLHHDLDYVSALRQHLLCGRGLNETLMTPAEIKRRYFKACEEKNIPADSGRDYPFDWELDLYMDRAMFKIANPKTNMRGNKGGSHQKFRAASHKSRSLDTQNRLAEARKIEKIVGKKHIPLPPPARPQMVVVPRAGIHSTKNRKAPPAAALRERVLQAGGGAEPTLKKRKT